MKRGGPWIFLAAALLVSAPSRAEWAAGIELQAYPVGTISGLHLRAPLVNDKWLTFRAAYNDTDRDDNGEHDDETGGGAGISIGYRQSLDAEPGGWAFGGRVDLWDLEIDWTDMPAIGPARVGTTEVLVLQPTVEAAYGWSLGDSAWLVELTLSLGAEINIDTDGEDVGEGAILLGGVQLLRRF